MEQKKTFWQIVKFVLVSCIVTVIQLGLVNLLFFLMKNWKAPLPSFLQAIFTGQTVGEGNDNWGYVLPFLLSNLIANIYGYFQNRKTTFSSNSPKAYVIIYLVIIFILILFSTWLQGVVANALIQTKIAFLQNLAPTLAGMSAGTLQMIVLFPLEKFVLFRHKEEKES